MTFRKSFVSLFLLFLSFNTLWAKTAIDTTQARKNATLMSIIQLLLLDDSPALPSAPPQLVSPADSARNLALPVLLVWNKVANDSLYTLNVSTTSDFSKIVIDTAIADTSLTPRIGLILNDHTYYWRVSSTKKGGEVTVFSDTVFFSTIPSLPPALVSPVNNATNILLSPMPTLIWRKTSTDSAYVLHVSKNQTFDTVVVDAIVADTTKLIDIGLLAFKQNYYWRVATIKKGAEKTAYSDTFKFTTADPKPGSPSLVWPIGEKSLGLTVNMRWNKVAIETKYIVQISKTSTFAQIYKSDSTGTASDTTIAMSNFGYDTTYYWRVQAVNISGSALSLPGQFKTIVQPIVSAVTLRSPNNNDTIRVDSVLLIWNKHPLAGYYRTQVYSIAGPDTNFLKDISVSDTTIQVKGLTNKSWQWRVLAKNANPASASIWSVARTFIAKITGLGVRQNQIKQYAMSFEPGNSTITFALPKETRVSAILYTLNGRQVQRIVESTMSPGTYRISLPRSIGTGTYVLLFKAGKFYRKDAITIDR